MSEKYYPGKDCTCSAFGYSECACGADWTDAEVYELRDQLKHLKAERDKYKKALEKYGQHKTDCKITMMENNMFYIIWRKVCKPIKCTCGLDKALNQQPEGDSH